MAYKSYKELGGTPKTGSIRIKPEIYALAWEYCKNNGINISFFGTGAMVDKLKASGVKIPKSK